jgi:hypothetical protein
MDVPSFLELSTHLDFDSDINVPTFLELMTNGIRLEA